LFFILNFLLDKIAQEFSEAIFLTEDGLIILALQLAPLYRY